MRKQSKILWISALILCWPVMLMGQEKPSHNWSNHAEVARQVIKKFDDLNSVTGHFQITTTDGGRTRTMRGRYYFQKPNKLRYEFDSPAGNLIVSNGRVMWFYIRRNNLVGRQDLSIQKNNSSGQPIFVNGVVSGLRRLFNKYHYKFDSAVQPREIDGKKTYVLSMNQRTRIGGYEKLTLYVDASTFLVRKAEGSDGYGKKSRMVFNNIKLNPSLEGKLFQYSPDDRVRVVKNPFVKDDKEAVAAE